MGLLGTVTDTVAARLSGQPVYLLAIVGFSSLFTLAIVLNVLHQLLPVRRKGSDPPVVFHWVPFIGSTITYGIDPYKFFFRCREQVHTVITSGVNLN